MYGPLLIFPTNECSRELTAIGPNGGNDCKYKHSLPAGFVLKTKEQRAAEKALMDKSPLATLTLEDFLEARR